jgi:RNA polymerase sigma factor (sigma-70 family)
MRYERAELVDYPQAYLFKMASNVVAEWSLHARNRRPHRDTWLEGLADSRQPELPLLLAQSHAEIERALGKLSAQQRQIMRLFFAEGLRYAEIAERLGLSLRSVRRQFAKSYEKLRDELDPELLGVLTHGRD